MPFVSVAGLPGKVYVPEKNPDGEKKHPCPDCFSCQMCCDTRCAVCRCGKKNAGRPLITLKATGSETTEFSDLDWRIQTGQHWILFGPTGSGKSALAAALAGKPRRPGMEARYYFDDPARYPRGRSHYAHDEIISVSADDNGRGRFGDGFYQARWHSMLETSSPRVRDFLFDSNEPGSDNETHLLENLAVDQLLDRRLIHLSSGEQHKIRIARALLRNPRLIIFKEPFSGLDAPSRKTLRRLIENLLSSATPQLVLSVSRPQDLVQGFTHAVRLENRHVVAMGKINDVLAPQPVQPESPPRFETLSGCSAAAEGETIAQGNVGELVRLTDVTVTYGSVRVLDRVNWTMRKNEHWAILGPNGAGKSTLLSLVTADNPQAYANDITLFGMKRGSGESIWDIKKHIGWMAPELRMFYPGDTPCVRVVCSGFYDSIGLFRNPTPDQEEAACKTMASFEISDLEKRPFHQISAGQQRMALIARAMVKKPDLLILDEPCQGLDAQKREMIIGMLDRLTGQTATRLIYVTHYAEEIPRSITHALFLESGRVTGCGRLTK